MTTNLWIAILFAGALSLLTPFVWRPLLAKVGAVDIPNQRSSHSKPTVRGGGIASLTAVLVGGLIAGFVTNDEIRLTLLAIIIVATLVSLLGLAEDIFGLPVKVRAGAQFFLGAIFSVMVSWITDNNWLWVPVAAIFFAANVNFTNFMDGINGISSLHGLVVGLAFAWIGNYEELVWLTVLGILNAIVYATFLPWNLIPPGMFLGDAGSYLLGGMNASMALAAIWAGINPVMALAPLSIYWVDTVSTLARRLVLREPIFEAHRTHTYQQLTDHRLSHVGVALIVAVFTILASLVGFETSTRTPLSIAAALLALAALWSVYLALPSLNRRKKVLA